MYMCEVAEGRKLQINNNMRCFEMMPQSHKVTTKKSINNNMRCFEMNRQILKVSQQKDKQ